MRSPPAALSTAITCCMPRVPICSAAAGPRQKRPRATPGRWSWLPMTASDASSSAGCAKLSRLCHGKSKKETGKSVVGFVTFAFLLSPFDLMSSVPPSGRSLIAEIAGPGQIEDFGRQFQRPAVKAADVAGTLDQVARLTGAQIPFLGTVTLQQLVDDLRSHTNPLALGIDLGNAGVLFRSGRFQTDAIAHAPQEGWVRDGFRAQVSGDDEHMAQWQLDLLTRAQREKVNLVLHGRA